jgi:hypothetical protein
MKQFFNRFCSHCGREYHPNDQAIMCEGCGTNNSIPNEREQNRQESLEMVLLYAKDLLDYWPHFSFKTVPIMMKKMDALKQAIEAVK